MTNKSIQIAHIKFLKDLSQIKVVWTSQIPFASFQKKLVLKDHSETSKLKASCIINSLFGHQNNSLLWDTYQV